mmetsp:Transcript_17771/g.54313  ORF Transcript_17771/g.54313 Transcript_17771/m.54313 type:complete len:202 (-) Transcript_17771:636-1241(-)
MAKRVPVRLSWIRRKASQRVDDVRDVRTSHDRHEQQRANYRAIRILLHLFLFFRAIGWAVANRELEVLDSRSAFRFAVGKTMFAKHVLNSKMLSNRELVVRTITNNFKANVRVRRQFLHFGKFLERTKEFFVETQVLAVESNKKIVNDDNQQNCNRSADEKFVEALVRRTLDEFRPKEKSTQLLPPRKRRLFTPYQLRSSL